MNNFRIFCNDRNKNMVKASNVRKTLPTNSKNCKKKAQVVREKFIYTDELPEVEDEILQFEMPIKEKFITKRTDNKPIKRKRSLSTSSSKQKKVSTTDADDKQKNLCTECSGEFKEGEFRRHNQTEHILYCSHDGCPNRFVDNQSLRSHIKHHHPPPPRKNVCKFCGKNFESDKSFQAHQGQPHPNTCSSCSLSFSKKSDLTEHLKTNHPTSKTSKKISSESLSKAKTPIKAATSRKRKNTVDSVTSDGVNDPKNSPNVEDLGTEPQVILRRSERRKSIGSSRNSLGNFSGQSLSKEKEVPAKKNMRQSLPAAKIRDKSMSGRANKKESSNVVDLGTETQVNLRKSERRKSCSAEERNETSRNSLGNFSGQSLITENESPAKKKRRQSLPPAKIRDKSMSGRANKKESSNVVDLGTEPQVNLRTSERRKSCSAEERNVKSVSTSRNSLGNFSGQSLITENEAQAKKKRRQSLPAVPEKSDRKRSISGRSKSSSTGSFESEQYWSCELCQEVFPALSKLEAHQAKIHKFECEHGCQMSFLCFSDRLRHHYEEHGVKRQLYKCNMCLEMMDSKSKRTHSGRFHGVHCPEENCHVRSNEAGIWVHRIKKHNFGMCMNDPVHPEEHIQVEEAETHDPLDGADDLNINQIEVEIEQNIDQNVDDLLEDDGEADNVEENNSAVPHSLQIPPASTVIELEPESRGIEPQSDDLESELSCESCPIEVPADNSKVIDAIVSSPEPINELIESSPEPVTETESSTEYFTGGIESAQESIKETKSVLGIGTVTEEIEINPERPTEEIDTNQEPPSEEIETNPEPPITEIETTLEHPIEEIETTPGHPTDEIETTPEPPTEDIVTFTESPTEEIEAVLDPLNVVIESVPDPPNEKIETVPDPPNEEIETVPNPPNEEIETVPDPPNEEIETVPDPQNEESETVPDPYEVIEAVPDPSNEEIETTPDPHNEVIETVPDPPNEEKDPPKEEIVNAPDSPTKEIVTTTEPTEESGDVEEFTKTQTEIPSGLSKEEIETAPTLPVNHPTVDTESSIKESDISNEHPTVETETIQEPPSIETETLSEPSNLETDTEPSTVETETPKGPEFLQCPKCKIWVASKKFSRHLQKGHNRKCLEPECTLLFSTKKDQFQHCFRDHSRQEEACQAGYQICPECVELFDEYQEHQFKLHRSVGSHLTCPKCEYKYGEHNRDLYQFHLHSLHSSSDLRCPLCDVQFTSTDKIRYKTHSSQSHIYGPCPHCPAEKPLRFLTQERFYQHHTNCAPPGAACDCKKFFTRVTDPHFVAPEFNIKTEGYELNSHYEITLDSSVEEVFMDEVNEVYDNIKAEIENENVNYKEMFEDEENQNEYEKLEESSTRDDPDPGIYLEDWKCDPEPQTRTAVRETNHPPAPSNSVQKLSTLPEGEQPIMIHKKSGKTIIGKTNRKPSRKYLDFLPAEPTTEGAFVDQIKDLGVAGKSEIPGNKEESTESKSKRIKVKPLNSDGGELSVDVKQRGGEPIGQVKKEVEEESNIPVSKISESDCGQINEDKDDGFDEIDALLMGDSDEEDISIVSNTNPPVPVKVPTNLCQNSFKCPSCLVVFKKEQEFNVHIKKSHPFKCKVCPLSFTFANGLSEHTNIEHPNELDIQTQTAFTCDACNVSFKRETSFLAHHKKDHDFQCPECHLRFTGEVFLEEHLLKCHNLNSVAAKKARRRSPVQKRKKSTSRSVSKSSRKEKKPKSEQLPKVEALEQDDESQCAKCHLHIEDTAAFEDHINEPHPYPCFVDGCNLMFTTEYFHQLHLFEAHSIGTLPRPVTPPSTYNGGLLKINSSDIVGQTFETLDEKMTHDKLHHTPEKLVTSPDPVMYKKSSRSGTANSKKKKKDEKKKSSHSKLCQKCGKTFNDQNKYLEHKKVDHKFKCKEIGCSRKYPAKADLSHHMKRRHSGIVTKKEVCFSCSTCGKTHLNKESLKTHKLENHSFTCHVDHCNRGFVSSLDLSNHLASEHNINQMWIDETSCSYLTCEKSEANVRIAKKAEEWIKSEKAVSRLKEVMRGTFSSKRHKLFLIRRERERCNGNNMSTLHKLSNTGFLGSNGKKDSDIISWLMKNVFNVYFKESDPALVALGEKSAFVYTSCVLFPETFIHQHQEWGKTREHAEKAFMEVVVDMQERNIFNQDVQEAIRNKKEEEEESGEDWVDHSDMEDY